MLADAGWQLLARCREEAADTFFPPDHERGRTRRARESRAKQICRACPVLEECRRYALTAQEPYGIWGATTAEDRQQLLYAGHRTLDSVPGVATTASEWH